MKICFLMYQGNMFSGGQGIYLYYLTRELARLGHEVHVIALPSLLLSFSVRAYVKLNELAHHHRFDIIHDNQTLSYGNLLMQASGYPMVATVHHPLSVDLRNSLAPFATLYERARRLLWYPWIMQET